MLNCRVTRQLLLNKTTCLVYELIEICLEQSPHNTLMTQLNLIAFRHFQLLPQKTMVRSKWMHNQFGVDLHGPMLHLRPF